MKYASYRYTLVSILVGLLFLAIGLIGFFRFDPDAYDVSTVATISRIEETTEYDSSTESFNTVHTVYIDYTAGGQRFEDVEYGSYNSSMREGNHLKIYYMSDDPSCITGEDKEKVPYFFLGGAVLGAVMLGVDIVRLRRKGR